VPYNEDLDARITEATSTWGATRRKMFGGTCYLLNGNMLCGVYKDFLIVRLGQEAGTQALQEPFTAPFDITGRAMTGWVMVEERGFRDDLLPGWLNRTRTFATTLPAK
jgi:hypothetical protein